MVKFLLLSLLVFIFGIARVHVSRFGHPVVAVIAMSFAVHGKSRPCRAPDPDLLADTHDLLIVITALVSLTLVLSHQLQAECARIVATWLFAQILTRGCSLLMEFHVMGEIALVNEILLTDVAHMRFCLGVMGQLVGHKGRMEFEALAGPSSPGLWHC